MGEEKDLCTNFDFLKQNNEQFSSFSTQAIEAEKSIMISSATCAILTRRALELAVKWVYSFDRELTTPYDDKVSSLIHGETFRSIIEPSLFPMLKYTIKLGNIAVHTSNTIKRDDAVLSLRNLFQFCKWIYYCYANEYQDVSFDEGILNKSEEQKKRPEELKDLYDRLSSKDKKLEEIQKENEQLREQMTLARYDNSKGRAFKVDEISETETRKKYIDLDLKEAGWVIGTDCLEEVEVAGMPNSAGIGFIDYVLYGNDGLPLAVVEAKRTSKDPIVGSQQAKLYADCLQNKYIRRPFIFTSNGFEVFLTDDLAGYPRRKVFGVFTKEELQLLIDRRDILKPLNNIEINDAITNRPYQKEAITRVCEAINNRHRKMLVVQATGSGKTRVSISLVDVLRRHNYVKNILFLADRKALVRQAKKNYSNMLPDLTLCNLLDGKDNPEQSRMIFSTYPTMMHAIDEAKNEFGEKMFTPAHFDLIIIDESHRSIYKKYKDIFDYFDGMLLGLTATPKNGIDKNTYEIFELERDVPTFNYDLDKAVEEGYLVTYEPKQYKTRIMEDGIHYNDLSEEEKEEFEKTFEDDDTIEDTVTSDAINEWLYNANTIDLVLKEVMEKGIKIESGTKLGKTIIFAKKNDHAKAIVDRFHFLYPEYGDGFIKEIDYSINYVDTLIDDFSTKDKLPQIAVSVDMLDTGIDIPEIVNLVFFKKVRSYSKFWQMIGRGTRLCENLLGIGQNKEKFYVFDFCNNIEFFAANKSGVESDIQESYSEKIFNVKTMIIRESQASRYACDNEYVDYREKLMKSQRDNVMELNDNSFRVRNHKRFVEMYRQMESWRKLETVNISEIKEHISPIVMPTKEDDMARRFNYLMYTIQLAFLQSKDATKPIKTLVDTATSLSGLYSIPQVKEKKDIIEMVMTQEFWDNVSVIKIDEVREALKDLIRFIEKDRQMIYYTDFQDEIIDYAEGEPINIANEMRDYKKKVEYYLKEHKENLAVYKLRNNKKLSEADLKELESILWNDLGTKKDYEKEYGSTPIGKLVRKITGVERSVLNEAFSEFLTEERLNSNQIRFVSLIIDYIVANGNIEDNSVLMEEPFRSCGSITTIFKEDMGTAKRILGIVQDIKKNSEDIA